MTVLFNFATFPILTSERLRLRQITHADAPQMMAMFSDPTVLEFLNIEPVDTLEKAIGMIDWFAGNYNQQAGIDWAITLKDDDRLIGMCGAYEWERFNRHIDIGYHLLPAYWGKGYATEATKCMISWCFQHLDLHRIQADCTDGNHGSERVLLKCGFQLEGIQRENYWEHGRFVNSKLFGLLRREFSGI